MLIVSRDDKEVGCDEAGRGCLAGPVVAAAVCLPKDYHNPQIRDSKKLSPKRRLILAEEIKKSAITYAIATVPVEVIDEINILQASILGMHQAVELLTTRPDLLLIDGPYFRPYQNTPHKCVVRGDNLYQTIAAASILAKVQRDALMLELDAQFPEYGWAKNKGYGTLHHREALKKFGPSPFHRQSFRLNYD